MNILRPNDKEASDKEPGKYSLQLLFFNLDPLFQS